MKKLKTLNINYIIFTIVNYLKRNKAYYKNYKNSLSRDALYLKKVKFILRNKSFFIRNFYTIKLTIIIKLKFFIFRNKISIFFVNKIILYLRYLRLYIRRFYFFIFLINFFNLQFYISFSIDTLRGLYQLFFNYCEKKLINLYFRIFKATLVHKRKVFFYKLFLFYKNIRLKFFFIFFYIFCLINILFNKTFLINTPLDSPMPIDRKEFNRPNIFTRFLPLPFLENVLFLIRPFYRYLNTFNQIKINISVLNKLFYFYIFYDFIHFFLNIYIYILNKFLKIYSRVQDNNFFFFKLLFIRFFLSLDFIINILSKFSFLKLINICFKQKEIFLFKFFFFILYLFLYFIVFMLFFFIFLYFFHDFILYFKFFLLFIFFYYFFYKFNLFFFNIRTIEIFFFYLYFDKKAYNMLHSLYIFYLFKLKKKLLFGNIIYSYLIKRLNMNLKLIDKDLMKVNYLNLSLNNLNYDDIHTRYMNDYYSSNKIHSLYICDISCLIRLFFKNFIGKNDLNRIYNLIYLAYIKRCKVLSIRIKFKYINLEEIIFLNNLDLFNNFNYITLLFFINFVICYDSSKNLLFKLNPTLKKKLKC